MILNEELETASNEKGEGVFVIQKGVDADGIMFVGFPLIGVFPGAAGVGDYLVMVFCGEVEVFEEFDGFQVVVALVVQGCADKFGVSVFGVLKNDVHVILCTKYFGGVAQGAWGGIIP
jgi:hypothetical protein